MRGLPDNVALYSHRLCMSDFSTNPQANVPGNVTRAGSEALPDDLIRRTLDVDAIMHRVRSELSKRGVAADGAQTVAGTRWHAVAARLPERDHYTLADFFRFDDEDFVDVVYRTLLRRPANDAGSKDYLAALRSGAVSKVEVLGLIRFSDEGMKHSVHVDGLLLPYRLHRWRRIPVLGWFLGMGMALARLPGLSRRLQVIEASTAHETQALGRWVNRLDAAVARRLLHAEGERRGLREDLARANDEIRKIVVAQNAIAEAQDAIDAKLRDSDAGHKTALAALNDQLRGDHRRLLAMLERLTVFLDGATRQPSAGGGSSTLSQLQSVEQQYASFEEVFRGERGQIKLRVAHYLAALAAAGIAPGSGEVVLDLGSGRGEWLEVLAEHGYSGRGVDLNRGMLEESEKRGHEVVEADVLNYLKAQDGDSVAAITSMHLVEHIPHPVLIQLLDEALRVLRPGGVLILETPNPENVLVGSCRFYMDPTHLNPIPPLLLQWTVQARGFERAVIERLSEHRGDPEVVPVSETVPGAAQINRMIGWFTAPPDYAVIARKAAHN
jgi:O-antigen chain-terminating methyltransferase